MPFKSQAQRRLFYAKARRGEISESKVREWESETPKGKKLPEKVAGIVPKKALVAAGALAVPYAVGKNVQKQQQQQQQQQEQVVEKTAAFEIGFADGVEKVAAIDPRRARILPNFGASHEEEIEEAVKKHEERVGRHGQGGEDVRAASRYGAVTGALGGATGALYGAILGKNRVGKPKTGKGALIGGLVGAGVGTGLGALGGFMKSRERGALSKRMKNMSPQQKRQYLGELARDIKHQEMLTAMSSR